MTYKFDSRFIGYPPIEAVVPVPTATVPPFGYPISPGFIATAEDPIWGPGEFVFARAGAGIRIYGGCQFLPVWDATNKVYTYNMTEWTATANSGRPYYIYQGTTAATTGQYGWFQMSGRSPLNCSADLAAGARVGHNATGQGTADAATLGINNAVSITPGTNTVASLGRGIAGDNVIFLDNTAGFFVGGYLSGTGVGAAAIVTSVNPLGKYITASVVNSAAIGTTVTQTANNATIFLPVIEFNRMGGGDEA